MKLQASGLAASVSSAVVSLPTRREAHQEGDSRTPKEGKPKPKSESHQTSGNGLTRLSTPEWPTTRTEGAERTRKALDVLATTSAEATGGWKVL